MQKNPPATLTDRLTDRLRYSDESAYHTVSAIITNFTGGNKPVDPPACGPDQVVAYSPEQAKTIFENLMDAKVGGLPIPFLAAGHEGGQCASRMRQMVQHMMFRQGIAPEAIGIAISKLDNRAHPHGQKIPDYYKRIEHALGLAPENDGLTSRAFGYHIAPTIRVGKDGDYTDFVLDPGLRDKPVAFKEWAAAQSRTIAVGHCNLLEGEEMEGIKKACVLGDLSEKEANDLFESNYKRTICTSAQLIDAAKDRESDKMMYQQAYDEDARKSLAPDQDIQNDLITVAKLQGIDLPNCGPRALRAVEKHLNRQNHSGLSS